MGVMLAAPLALGAASQLAGAIGSGKGGDERPDFGAVAGVPLAEFHLLDLPAVYLETAVAPAETGAGGRSCVTARS